MSATTAITSDAESATGLRVLFVSHETTLSGAPMQLLHVIPLLAQRGWDILFAAPEPGPISDLLQQAGVAVEFDPTFLTDLEHVKLRALCRGFDVVIANTIAAWLAVRAAHREGVPVVWYIHETLVGIHLIGEIPEIRPTLDRADLIITPTRQTARIYEGLSRTRCEVVPYGIPDLGYSPRARASGEPTNFLLLGSYEERKGQDVLLDALRAMPPAIRARGRFTLAGRPLDRAFFERAQRSAEVLENVRLLTGLQHETAARLMRETDVLVVSSRDETMPIAILEAMSLGRSVISTDVGGIREWLRDRVNAFLVPRENPRALAAAIEKSISNPQLLESMAATARRSYEQHFQIAQFAEAFADSLLRVRGGKIGKAGRQTCSYAERLREFDTFAESDRTWLRRRVRMLKRHPLISVVMPVYNPEPQFLTAAIRSVRTQIYAEWELCIADDASTDPRIRELLSTAAESDPRIKVLFRTANGHISACSNSALELARGEWCAFLDHDDVLAENALALVAAEINGNPNAGLIYSDEDKIDAVGVRSDPFFKTDYDPELFLAQNYINHLGVYRTSLLREVGGFREGYEGSQDYDLALRVLERLRIDQVHHLPFILYHWRKAPGSLAAVANAKPYAREAARRAIADHLRRVGVNAEVEPCPENDESHRVRYELPNPPPEVSIIIATRDKMEMLETCLTSVRSRTDYPAFEIVIVDNGSIEPETRDYLQHLTEQGHARVLRDESDFNFSRLNNHAARHATGELLLFMNNDIEVVEEKWLREMVIHATLPDVAAVGARLWYADETLQHGGVVLGLGGVAGHAHHRVPRGHPGYFNRACLQHSCSAATGACLLVKKSSFDAIGGFDETNLGVDFNDVDLCLRLRERGWRVVWTPYADLIHHESLSRGHHSQRDQQAQFFREASFMQKRYGSLLLNDPFYNPNLSLKLPGYEVACPPRKDWRSTTSRD